MKALVYEGNEQINLKDCQKPVPNSGEALIKVELAGICGSDIVAFKGGLARIKPPVILGHEFTGRIAELNLQEEQPFYVGERVIVEPIISCNICELCKTGNYNVCKSIKVIGYDIEGAFAEYVKVPIKRIHKIPETLSIDRAALCEPVAVATHMIRKTGLKYSDSVLILGAGPIGLLVGMVAKEAGVSKIAITDINQYRLSLASELGLKAFSANDKEIKKELDSFFEQEGADITFELAAAQSTAELAVEVTKIKGTILAGGIFKKPPEFDMQKLTLREQTLLGSRMYNFIDFENAINILINPGFLVEKLITDKISMDEVVEKGFNRIIAGENVMKILIDIVG